MRFDAGHGGCYIFVARGLMVRARDTEIVGGFGSSPGNGGLFRSRPFLARFERCRLELVELGLRGLGRGSKVVFRDCAFVSTEREGDPMLTGNPNVAFVGCRSEVLEHDDRHELQRDLSELFYGFRK